LEIWINIIEYIPREDCGSAWLNCRPVSRVLKAATEAVFMQRHVPRLRVVYGRQLEDICNFARQWLSFKFERFTEDLERVIMVYRIPPRYSDRENWQDYVKASFRHQMTAYSDAKNKRDRLMISTLKGAKINIDERLVPIIRPYHTMTLGKCYARDTELPGFQYDLDSFSVSFEWKPALSIFFGEEEYHIRLLAKHPASDGLWLTTPVWDPELLQRRGSECVGRLEMAKEVEIPVRHLRSRKWQRRHNVSGIGDTSTKELDNIYKSCYWRLLSFRLSWGWGQQLSDDEAENEREDSGPSVEETWLLHAMRDEEIDWDFELGG
jgi:hypothetical protein